MPGLVPVHLHHPPAAHLCCADQACRVGRVQNRVCEAERGTCMSCMYIHDVLSTSFLFCRGTLTITQQCDILRGGVIVIVCFCLQQVDASKVYHLIRAQVCLPCHPRFCCLCYSRMRRRRPSSCMLSSTCWRSSTSIVRGWDRISSTLSSRGNGKRECSWWLSHTHVCVRRANCSFSRRLCRTSSFHAW